MSATFKTIQHADAFGVLRNSHGVILSEYETAHIATALEGVSTILALLQQQALDVGQDPGEGLSFDENVTLGLLAAAATCTEFANNLVDSGGLMGARAAFGTKAYARLIESRNAIERDKRKEGGTV
jgi:hypothetical protein